MKKSILPGFAVLAFVAAGCGSQPKQTESAPPPAAAKPPARVDVKHAVDPDAAKIDKSPKPISVESLVAMKLPDGVTGNLESFPNKRIGPFETTVYKMDAKLKSIVHRKDGDYYMVVTGKSGAEAVVEVPDPEQCKSSPLYAEIKSTREELEKRFHPGDKPTEVDQDVSVQGVGFYGFRGRPGSGTQGRSPRLMPGTHISFGH